MIGYLDTGFGLELVDILAYDRNKYVTVRQNGEVSLVKRGYLFRDALGQVRFPAIFWYQLPRAEGLPRPSRLQASQELKALRRHSKTRYMLHTNGAPKCSDTLVKALRMFSDVAGDCFLTRFKDKGRSSMSGAILTRENGELFIITHGRGYHEVKQAHLRKFGIAA
ncbi:porin [Novimethylophilus kurashikiensis]|uniref:Porin n=1 Tax=Novimethylophilus kurashikiensis TaxID=1825523 RepID=A0A2R5F9F1_9PROT|nr:hypothetical protein [Novimethylophilus kurashikiensis]GBG14860.1 porin [Novimethylophilus kurashikiensis]